MPINAEILRRYMLPSKTLIETGTHVGEGVQAALDAGYESVLSFDLEHGGNAVAAEKFKGNPHVRLVIADSRKGLERLFYGMPLNPDKRGWMPVVFWLDAHATDGGSGSYEDCPLLGELAMLAEYPINTHTILIDDIRLIGSDALRLDRTTDNYSMWKLLDAIRNINPNYHCELIHSPLFCFDILACTVP